MTMDIPLLGLQDQGPWCVVHTLRDYCPVFLGHKKENIGPPEPGDPGVL